MKVCAVLSSYNTFRICLVGVKTRWKEAMNEEMNSFQKNSTWKVVELPNERYLLDVCGFSQSNTRQMNPLNDYKLD